MMMGETAEVLAEEFKISRADQDVFALSSHQKAIQAVRTGKFKDEIVPVPVSSKSKNKKENGFFEEDEGPNLATDLKVLGQLAASFKENGTVTAGNSCQISDGAAGVVVTTKEKAGSLGLEILATLRAWAFTGVDPRRMGMGPVDSTRQALKKAQLDLKDIRLAEINEAFAAQCLAVEGLLEIDPEIVNVNGGAIALGHPVGATGTRIVVTLLHEMKRRGVALGFAGLCVGGGQGGTLIFERR